MMARSWTVGITHSLKAGNICLDLLAKMGANTVEKEVTLEAPPESLGRTLLADAMRIAHLR